MFHYLSTNSLVAVVELVTGGLVANVELMIGEELAAKHLLVLAKVSGEEVVKPATGEIWLFDTPK